MGNLQKNENVWMLFLIFALNHITAGNKYLSFIKSKQNSLRCPNFVLNGCVLGVVGGVVERRLLNDLMEYYQKLERPVANESETIMLKFGLTLQQIMDMVRY